MIIFDIRTKFNKNSNWLWFISLKLNNIDLLHLVNFSRNSQLGIASQVSYSLYSVSGVAMEGESRAQVSLYKLRMDHFLSIFKYHISNLTIIYPRLFW